MARKKEIVIMDQRTKLKISLLALSKAEGIGEKTIAKIISRELHCKSSWMDSINRTDLLWYFYRAKIKIKKDVVEGLYCNKELYIDFAKRALDLMCDRNISLLFSHDKEFPEILNARKKTGVQWLFVDGNTSILKSKMLAVIGSREPHPCGKYLVDMVCDSLSNTGITSVSGLAKGIDEAAHLASLSAGVPTVAVLGNDILDTYPASSRRTREMIVEAGGCIISEYAPGSKTNRGNFVRRNRIQAGLSSGIIPVQFSVKSGTMHTINYAIEYQVPIIGVRTDKWIAEGWEAPELKKRRENIFTLPRCYEDYLEYIRRGFGYSN
jgi:DNA protecting protein DprA